MLRLPSGNLMVETPNELPNLSGATNLFCDFETVSGDPKRGGDRPYHGDRICGIAVTADAISEAFYIPIRHSGIGGTKNLDLGNVQRWLCSLLETAKNWINHNVKFDAHFAAQDGAIFGGRLVDTLTLAKLHYSDSINYGLKYLGKNWLSLEMEESKKLEAYLKGMKTKDFADAPPDMLGDYACEDVQTNRQLYNFLVEKRPAEMTSLWETEILLTPVLFDMEQAGMPIVPQELKIENALMLRRLVTMNQELIDILGYEFNPKSSAQVRDLFLNRCGVKCLAWKMTKNEDGVYQKGNPTFDKAALKLYAAAPEVMSDPKLQRVLELITSYREDAQYNSLFVETYRDLHAGGLLHPSYNQLVRTGRMACRAPNAQQLNKRAKKLIHAKEGCGILSFDYSQVEFRLIVHYIKNEIAIRAYNENPDTDFHQFMADQCGITRKSAKNLNFAIGYGAGKNKILSMLRGDPGVIKSVAEKLGTDTMDQFFIQQVERLANRTYNDYHFRLPELRLISKRAESAAKSRGYVFNNHGRRRHFSPSHAFRAFNSIVQGDAADIAKERLVALAPRYNSESRRIGYEPFGIVHDEIVAHIPLDFGRDPACQRFVKDILENPDVSYRVPIRVEGGYSEKTWADAGGENAAIDFDLENEEQTELDNSRELNEISGISME